MIAHAPILSDEADIYDEDPENLKSYGLFVPTFPTDAKKVWAILLACFGLSSTWQHVKKFASHQNGHQAWRTLCVISLLAPNQRYNTIEEEEACQL